VRTLASLQETSLDIVWIRDGVVCLGYRPAERCYRATLAVEGPPEAFAQEVERAQPLLDGFASFLNALGQSSTLPPGALQALVRSEPTDLGEYAARLERRALMLPPHLAREVLTDAAWARQKGPGLGLLDRRGYLVVPAESVPGVDPVSRLGAVRSRFGRWFGARPLLDAAGARRALDTRCAELIERLVRGGVWAQRLDDAGLTRLFQACWSRRRDDRFEQDLRTCEPSFPSGPNGRS
jgi:hypothetical protein